MRKYKPGTLVRLRTHRSPSIGPLPPSFVNAVKIGATGLVFYSENRRIHNVGVQTFDPIRRTFWPEERFEHYWEILKEPDDDVAL